MPSPPPDRVISVDETAELVRQALSSRFPDTPFTVEAFTYAGSSTYLLVTWTAGPRVTPVLEITAEFEGMKYCPRSSRRRRKTHRVVGRGGSTEVVTYEPTTIALHRRPRRQDQRVVRVGASP